MSEGRRAFTAPGAPEAVGAYSHAVAAGGLLFCAGQVPLDPATGELVQGAAAAQAQRCLENLEAVCETAGARLADATLVTLYLTDLAGDFPSVNETYGAYFSDPDPPARVGLGVAALPKGASVEIAAVVVLPG